MINLSYFCVFLKAACAITKQFPKAVIAHIYLVLKGARKLMKWSYRKHLFIFIYPTMKFNIRRYLGLSCDIFKF